MNLYLSKDIVSNLEYDNDMIAVYVALKCIYYSERNDMYVSDNMLAYELTGDTEPTRYFKQHIHNGIEQLAKANIITVINKVGKSEYVIDAAKLNEDDYFVIITREEVRKIFSIQGKTDKFALLRYFIMMMITINSTDYIADENGKVKNRFVGYMPTTYLASLVGIPETIGIDYTAILEQIELIYVYRHNKYLHQDGEIRSICNHYGRYADAKYIKQFAEQYETTSGVITNDKQVLQKKGNNSRSLTQKYNALCNGKKYPIDTIYEIWKFTKEHNKNLNKDDDTYRSEDVFVPFLMELKEMQQKKRWLTK